MANLTRYTRNMEKEGINIEAQEKLITSKVLVMGAGGLGSGVIMNLAAIGVGQIKIIDGDVVEETGLNRQLIHRYKNIGRAKVMSAKDWIQEYNPDIKVELDKTNLNELNYFNAIQGYDIIVDCFDSYESKYMLNEIAVRHKKILVHGGVQAYCGQVTTIVPDKTGCLACVMPKPKMFSEEKLASFSPVVNVISALQAQEVFKIITGTGELSLNKLLVYDGSNNSFRTLGYSKNIVCSECAKVEFNG